MHFIIVTDLFKRYDLVVSPVNYRTSVYCRECEQWVAEFSGDVSRSLSSDEMMEKIIATHSTDVRGYEVCFGDWESTL